MESIKVIKRYFLNMPTFHKKAFCLLRWQELLKKQEIPSKYNLNKVPMVLGTLNSLKIVSHLSFS